MRNITKSPGVLARSNAKGLHGLDLSKIFEFGFKHRVDGNDEWHKEPDHDYAQHASSLASCPRQAVLRRAHEDTDGLTLTSALTFEVGHAYHRLLEDFCLAYEREEPRFKVLAMEAGGRHPELPLKARCDLLFSWEGKPILCDLKTEAPAAAARRRSEQEKYGEQFPVRAEHRIQVAAQAIVIEALMGIPKIKEARVLYVNKVSFDCDQVPVFITEKERTAVLNLVFKHEHNWGVFKETAILPPRLEAADEVWRCRPRTEADPKGIYCSCREACFVRYSSS